jgi:hypothetical protein
MSRLQAPAANPKVQLTPFLQPPQTFGEPCLVDHDPRLRQAFADLVPAQAE